MGPVDQNNRLTWFDIGRGLLRLGRKARPGLRSLATLALARPSRHMSLGRALERSAARHPDALCIKYEYGALSYRELNQWVNRIAHSLMQLGVKRGDAVAIFMDNRPAFLAVTTAAVKLGAIAALINTKQRRQVLAHSFRCSDAQLFIIGEELADAFAEVRPALTDLGAAQRPVCVMPDPARDRERTNHGDHGDHASGDNPPPQAEAAASSALDSLQPYLDLDRDSAARPPPNPDTTNTVQLDDPCFYVFTSGTTGLPKASILSHDRWLKAAAGFARACLDLRPDRDTIYVPLPLYHNLGLTIGWGGAVYTGAAIAIRHSFSARAFWDDCRRYDATAIAYIGEVPSYLLNQPPSARDRDHRVHKMLGVGLRPELWQRFKQRFGVSEIYEIYAASEMNVSFLNVMNLEQTVGFCPFPWALVEFDHDTGQLIRDAAGRCQRVRRGEPGLLLTKVSKRLRFEGYTDPAASERKLRRDVFKPGDVWFDSGDLMREIGFGHLQFVDRLGDTFRWKSENVSTTEVEQALGALDSVASCAVYGVEVPSMPGRAGMAAIVPRAASPDHQPSPERNVDLDLDALLAHANRELPPYAVPVFIRLSTALETTGTFKHRKAGLREQGYDPTELSEPLFVRLAGASQYRRLTRELYQQIQRREVTL